MDAISIICPGCGKTRPPRGIYDRARASGDWSAFHAATDGYGPCCNPICNGDWGTGCHHCHHPKYFGGNIGRWWIRSRRVEGLLPVSSQTGVCLLYMLALEIDERMATRTGERVCRACGGRGEVIACVVADVVGHRLVADVHIRSGSNGPDDPLSTIPIWSSAREVATDPCPCTAPTRVETIELHRLVELLADLPSPRFEWPSDWLAWLDLLQDGARETPPWIAEHAKLEVVPDWIARWWLAFREWTHAGKEPDADALAADLADLMVLAARERFSRFVDSSLAEFVRPRASEMTPWPGEARAVATLIYTSGGGEVVPEHAGVGVVGRIFRTVEPSIAYPGNTVNVEAIVPGEDGNLPAGLAWVVNDYITATSIGAASGGTGGPADR